MGIILAAFLGILSGYIISQIIYKNNLTYLTRLIRRQENKLEKGHLQESTAEDKIWYESALEFVFKFSEALSLYLDRHKVIEFLSEGARNFLYVERSVLLLWNKEALGLFVAGGVGLTKEPEQYPVLKNEDTISGFVMRHRQILVINDLEKEPYFKKMNKEEYLQKSFISVPLIFQNEVLGVLHVCDKKFTNPFTKRDQLLIDNISRIGAIALQNITLHEQIQQDYLKTINALALAIDARDSYTRNHSENVAKYALAIARDLQCRHYEIALLRQAALLHDIGKIGIKDSILLKADKLTPDEFAEIKQHPAKGEEIISVLPFLKDASRLIRHHHERYDGSGYPDGISGTNIERGARILAVADVFDAITTDRPYRRAFSFAEALKELEMNINTQFDPEIVESLRKVISEYGEKQLRGF